MNKSKVVNSKGEKLDIDVIFSFTCKENNKNYIAVNNNDDIFEKNSRYANLDILEIIKITTKAVYVSDIPAEDWQTVKKALQYNVFAKMGGN